jgi:hypothetical protein
MGSERSATAVKDWPARTNFRALSHQTLARRHSVLAGGDRRELVLTLLSPTACNVFTPVAPESSHLFNLHLKPRIDLKTHQNASILVRQLACKRLEIMTGFEMVYAYHTSPG